MKKRWLAMLVVGCMLIGSMGMTTLADEKTGGENDNTVNTDGEVSEKQEKEPDSNTDFTIENGVLTKYNGSGGDVIIPDGITSIGDNAFASCGNLASVEIPDGVINIGRDAFLACGNLTKVNLPDSITAIEWRAFCGTGLTEITIPAGVTKIEDAVFRECRALHSVTIPSGITSIGEDAFLLCENLTSVKIPESVIFVGDYAFSVNAITKIWIPSSIGEIFGTDAFQLSKTMLTDIIIMILWRNGNS